MRRREDATLIVAAPDLLAAMQILLRNGEKQGWNDSYSEDMEAARAAIAKATGTA
ncbi:Uncharacterised protein [Mycobacterium tuberculosis]|nr:Uncharacterised protein [Mycobacterium tuberculosis]